jgi:ABC-2 type transport system ATP-binding protein
VTGPVARLETNPPCVIETRDLTKHFHDVVAVDNLNLSVYKGEIFGLLGPDGAGKTTTIRMLSTIMEPSGGSARVTGLNTVKEREAIKKRIGYMAQQFALYGDLTVLENLILFADIFAVGRQEREARIARLLAFARLTEFTERRAAHLSGGMQKKLALACALIHAPEVIFLDEPTTGVDPVSRREFWDILTELHLAGVTIFVSTPYMDEAERCSRVGLMFEGNIIVCDEPGQIRGQVKGELLELWPDRLWEAIPLVEKVPGVLEVQTFGGSLRIFVDDAAEREAAIEEALNRAGLAVRGLRRVRPRLEEAFISLISDRLETRIGD